MNGQKGKHWPRAAGADSPLGSWKDLAAANAFGNRIYTDADLVKLREAHPKLYQSEASGDSPDLRAQVNLDAETAAIRIFKGADLSSIPHESAHIFVDDLRRVAADDGSMARERLRSDLEQAGMDGTPFAGILSGEVDAEMARAMLRDAREELAMLDDSDAGLRAAEKVPAKSESSKEGREEIRAALKTNAARRRELLPVERRLSAYVRHLDGLEQAKRDMATLRRFAGVAEDGELTDAQWREVQEYAARGFERYLMVFPTPVGVFLSACGHFLRRNSLPHARGGVSDGGRIKQGDERSSPRPWGCFLFPLRASCRRKVFPTPVGVFPPSTTGKNAKPDRWLQGAEWHH